MCISNHAKSTENYDKTKAQYPETGFLYSGRLLLPGDDAAIILTPGSLAITINDLPAPTDHPIRDLVCDEEFSIHDVASANLSRYPEVRILGRWHNDQTDRYWCLFYAFGKGDHREV